FFWTRYVESDHNRFLPAPHNHRFHRLVFSRVEFLVRNVWRNIDEVSRTCFVNKLKTIAPPKARAPTHAVYDSFEFSVLMRSGLRIRLHDYRAGPQFLRTHSRVRDGLSPSHAGSLRRVGIQLTAANDA